VNAGGALTPVQPSRRPRTLADALAAPGPARERLALARDVVAAVAALHARGLVHGALAPGRIGLEGGVALHAAPERRDVLGAGADAIPFMAPEVVRGGRARRRADVFAAGALVRAILAGVPADAEPPLEALRRALHGGTATIAEVLPAGIDAEVQRATERRWWRRTANVRRLLAALEGELGAGANANATAQMAGGAAQMAGGAARAGALLTPTGPTPVRPERSAREAGAESKGAPPPGSLPFRRRHAAIAAVAATLAGFLLLGGGDRALSKDVAARIGKGDLTGARALLDRAERDGIRTPVVEKLRGDLAFARGAPGECLRRYRVALAAEPALRTDPVLRENTRRLLAGAEGCGTKRAAAELLGELRDPRALPVLREAKRSSGLFGFLCTGDAIDRALAATRAAAPAE
jgi:eukaryotic-like serine/threonine-protein kinase